MVGQSINTKFKRVKQSAQGVAGSVGSQYARRVSITFNKASDKFENNEKVDHRQSTGETEGTYSVNGEWNGLLSCATYAPELSTLLLKDFAATAAIAGMSVTIGAPTNGIYPVSRAAGSFLTDGIKFGDVVRLTAGTFNAANLNKNLWVLSVTALQITVLPLNGSAMVAEGPIAAAGMSVPGKKSWVPMTGHTDNYYSWEKYQGDITPVVSELILDVKCGSAEIGLPASGNCTIKLGLPGLARATGAAEVLTSPTAATTTPVLKSVQGKVLVGGVITPVTSFTINIDGGVTPGEAEVGSAARSDHVAAPVKVSGTITAKFRSSVLQLLRDAQTLVPIAALAATDGTPTADFFGIVVNAAKIFTDDAPDGDAEVIKTYNWTGEIPATGGAALANHQTIVSIQDSAAP